MVLTAGLSGGNLKRGIKIAPMVSAVQGFGGGIEDAYNEGVTDRTTSNIAGAANAAIEYFTNKIIPGEPGFRNVPEATKTFKQALKSYGFNVVGEFGEESLAAILSPIINEFIYTGKKEDNVLEKLKSGVGKVDPKQVLLDGVAGAITAGILDSSSLVGNIQDSKRAQKNKAINKTTNIENAINDYNNSKPYALKTNTQQPILPVNQELIKKLETQKNKIDNEISKVVKKYENNPTENLSKINNLSQESTNIRNEIDDLNDNVNLPYKENINNIKQQQLDIINKTNPMADDYHTGIRNVEDIKTANEIFTIENFEETSYPDFTFEDSQKAIQDGQITIYSSNPIENGTFVSTSKMMAQDYAGGNKIYSKTIPLNEVAWIDNNEGQYAKVETTPYDFMEKNIPQDPTRESSYDVEPTREQVRKENVSLYREQASNLTENIITWKDKKLGLNYSAETMERNFYDIIPNKMEADRVVDTYIRPITKSNAQKEVFINEYNDKIKSLKLNDKESTAVQMMGEHKYNPETIVTGQQIDDFLTKNNLDHQKIESSVEVFRNTYDELIVKANQTLKDQGYKEISYRKGYFPHFVEDKATSIIGKMAEKLGWKVKKILYQLI